MARLIVLAVEGALASSIALPLEMLRAGQQFQRAHHRHAPGWDITVAGETREPVRMSGVLELRPSLMVDEIDAADLVIIPSLWRTPAAIAKRHPRTSELLKRLARSDAMLCSIGTGSYFLAATGLLNALPATTHWSFFEDFAQRFPQVQLQRRHLITRCGQFYCAGSINSAADLMIHFIGSFFGTAAAQQVESQFSPEIRRPFDAQSFVHGEIGAHPDEQIRMAQDWMLSHLAEPLRVPDLAVRVGLSTRTFSRRFRAAAGSSPVQYLQLIRLQTARDLLRQSNLSISEVAQRCGYPDSSHFSRAFAASTGSSPQSYRQRVRGKLFVAGAA